MCVWGGGGVILVRMSGPAFQNQSLSHTLALKIGTDSYTYHSKLPHIHIYFRKKDTQHLVSFDFKDTK